MDTLHDLARHLGPSGEIVLRLRPDEYGAGVEELIVDGTFAMDSVETSTERALAAVVTQVVGTNLRVLVGGLGLGYTAAEILANDAVTALDVVELEECLVKWASAGVTDTLAGVAADPRTGLFQADVGSVLTGATPEPAGPWDAILLDVDNGPDWLIHPANAALYAEEGLRAAYGRLRPGGVLAVWCQGPSTALLARLRTISATTREHRHEVVRGRRHFEYAIYTLTGSASPHTTT